MKKERLEQLLIGALEGGSNYWYMIDDPVTLEVINSQSPSTFSERAVEALLNGESLHINNQFSDDESGWLTIDVAQQALEIIEADHQDTYQRIIEDQEDANDYDLWLQIAVFGEVVYG